jgi:hypothetical protein
MKGGRRRFLLRGGALAASAAAGAGPAAPAGAQLGVARADMPSNSVSLEVLSEPGGGEVVTRLPQDAQVRVMGERPAPDGTPWSAVRLWGAVDGWVPSGQLAYSPAPPKPVGAPAAQPWQPPVPPPQGPFPLHAHGGIRVAADVAAEVDGPAIGRVAADTPVNVTAYATDNRMRAWVRLEAAPGAPAGGWALADRFMPATPDPLSATSGGRPLAERVRGAGMWFTYDVLRQTPTRHIIAAARANGFSFLAPEVGTSRRGYWAQEQYDALLPAAHDAGLKVIPWVYCWLADIPGDLELALRSLFHVAPSGDRPDGLGVDLEENLQEAPNRAFGQLLRALAGPEQLLIAITYQPQIASGRQTPFPALAESFNVLAPMAYWHARPIAYTEQDAYDYVSESARLVRQRVGRPDLPVAVIGQTFDWFSRNEIGPHNPSGAEVRGALRAARESGALGIGFFNWFSTTPEEWDAIAESRHLWAD